MPACKRTAPWRIPPISSLQIGQTAYTQHWAMWVDGEGKYWLHPDYPAHIESPTNGLLQIGREKDGFQVWLPKYLPTPIPEGCNYNSPSDTQYIPVRTVHHAC